MLATFCAVVMVELLFHLKPSQQIQQYDYNAKSAAGAVSASHRAHVYDPPLYSPGQCSRTLSSEQDLAYKSYNLLMSKYRESSLTWPVKPMLAKAVPTRMSVRLDLRVRTLISP
jgi:hypothetical protein